MRQEAHELAIVPLLEGIGFDAKLVVDEFPIAAAKALEQSVGAVPLSARLAGDELNGPKNDLAEMANGPRLRVVRTRGHQTCVVGHASPSTAEAPWFNFPAPVAP